MMLYQQLPDPPGRPDVDERNSVCGCNKHIDDTSCCQEESCWDDDTGCSYHCPGCCPKELI